MKLRTPQPLKRQPRQKLEAGGTQIHQSQKFRCWRLLCLIFIVVIQRLTHFLITKYTSSTADSFRGSGQRKANDAETKAAFSMFGTIVEAAAGAAVLVERNANISLPASGEEPGAQQNPSLELGGSAAAHNSTLTVAKVSTFGTSTKSGIKVAYIISITGCPTKRTNNDDTTASESKPSTVTVDGPAVLAHSIRRLETNFSTDLIAFVHPTARNCTKHLPSLGYIVLERELGFQITQIKNQQSYQHYIKKHGCCEEKEFLKLEAFTLLNYSVVMHLDTDLLVLQPMDAIVNAMMGIDTSGIHVLHKKRPLPSNIHFLYTRDYVQMSKITQDTSKFAVQGGFFAIRPSPIIYRGLIDTIKTGNFDRFSGWGMKRYSGYHGAPQIQGLLSYFYGESEHQINSGAVELHPCYYNSMVSFPPYSSNGNCRYYTPQSEKNHSSNPEEEEEDDCQDCAALDLTQLHSTHYTVCYKPWKCAKHKNFGQLCKDTHRAWFEARRDLELSWGYRVPTNGWNFNVTQGYCQSPKPHGYIPMQLPGTSSHYRSKKVV